MACSSSDLISGANICERNGMSSWQMTHNPLKEYFWKSCFPIFRNWMENRYVLWPIVEPKSTPKSNPCYWKTEQNLVFSDCHKLRFDISSCWLLIRGWRRIMKMRSSIFLKQCFGLCEGFWGFCVGLILNWIIIIASTARSYALYNGQIDNTNLDKSYPPIWTNPTRCKSIFHTNQNQDDRIQLELWKDKLNTTRAF